MPQESSISISLNSKTQLSQIILTTIAYKPLDNPPLWSNPPDIAYSQRVKSGAVSMARYAFDVRRAYVSLQENGSDALVSGGLCWNSE